jgi:hypothetical protein
LKLTIISKPFIKIFYRKTAPVIIIQMQQEYLQSRYVIYDYVSTAIEKYFTGRSVNWYQVDSKSIILATERKTINLFALSDFMNSIY